MKKKVFINMNCEAPAVTELDEYIKMLEGGGFEVEIDPRPIWITDETELIEKLSGMYAFLGSSAPFTARVFDACPDLKIIARTGVGYNTIDIPEATKRGIAVTTTPGAGAEAVSEFTLALILATARKVLECDKAVRTSNWVRFTGPSLFRKKLGIIGTGFIGKKLAEITKGFDMKILAYDVKYDDNFAKKCNVHYCNSIEELLKDADFTSIHVPLTESTRNLITLKHLKMMKPDAYIFNCARGGIINEADLYTALKEGIIAGAGIDVFDNEPVNVDNPLLTLDNIVVSTHNAGYSIEGKNSAVKGAAINLLEFESGKIPYGILNPQVLEKKA